MRVFLRFTVGMFRNKTQRIDLQTLATTDQLLQLVAHRIGKSLSSFILTYTQENIRIRIVKGWSLSHYCILAGTTLVVEYLEEGFKMPTDSLKTSKFLASVVPSLNPLELSQVQEVNQQHLKESMVSWVSMESNMTTKSNQTPLRKYLDQQLQLLLKQIQKGDLDSVSRILRASPELEEQHPELVDEANSRKQEGFINQLGQEGWAPIHIAVYYERLDIINFLLVKNADPNLQTADGWTPLQLGVLKKSPLITKTLLEFPPVRVSQLTAKGTALHIAVRQESALIASILMDHSANEHLKDLDGQTALDICPNDEIMNIINRKVYKQKQQQAIEKQLKQKPLISDLPILRGKIYRQSTLLHMKQKYLMCNPYQGTLIRYDSQQNCPKKPAQIIPLTTIKQIKLLPKSDTTWFMSSKYTYFEIFWNTRDIYGAKNQKIAKRWIKGIFQAAAFTIECERRKIPIAAPTAPLVTLILDDDKNTIGNPAITICQNPKPKSTQRKQSLDQNTLLKQITTKNAKAAADTSVLSTQTNSPHKLNQSLSYSPSKSLYDSNQIMDHEDLPQVQTTPNFNMSVHPVPTPDFGSILQETIEDPPMKKSPKTTTTTTTMISQTEELPVSNVKFSSFELIKVIGSGTFGKVFKAKLKSTGEMFALKALNKKTLIAKRNMKYAVSQTQILKQANHPFIVRLHYTFQTAQNLYMCMDYCSEGDLSLLIAQKQTIEQKQAVRIIAQLLLAVEYLHKKNIIYRDLKPQNILLCDDGFIKLADFGLCKELNQRDNSNTFCGSLAYISPEMLSGKEVGKHTDVYGLGCILYQLLSGQPPYHNNNINILQDNIKEGRLKFPPIVSPLAKQLILKLLQRDISKRISLQQAKRHPFFKGIDFQQLVGKSIGKIQLPQRILEQEDEDEERMLSMRPNFKDEDFPQGKFKNKIPNYTFIKMG